MKSKFTEVAVGLLTGKIKLTDEQKRFAKIITGKLKPDTVIGKGGEMDAILNEAWKEHESTR